VWMDRHPGLGMPTGGFLDHILTLPAE
jgi:hypothetical protein